MRNSLRVTRKTFHELHITDYGLRVTRHESRTTEAFIRYKIVPEMKEYKLYFHLPGSLQDCI